jgi:type II secretory ATPase GspE/PulE/Tfp pilus assembly ATPase PilB-like protein
MKKFLSLALAGLFLTVVGLAAQDPKPAEPAKQAPAPAPSADAEVIAQQLPSYPIGHCLVSDESLDAMGKPYELVIEGRLVRTCCKSCVKEVKKDPAKFFKQIDEAVIAAQKPSYPMKTCPVSGQALGKDSIDVVVGTRLVRLCCPDCKAGLAKDGAKFMAKVDAALIEAQKPGYAASVCPISGHKLEADSVDVLYGTRLVRLCCPDCIAGYKKDPAKVVAKLDEIVAAGKR